MVTFLSVTGFSFLVDPWWVIPLEILESVSNGLLSTVGVMYCTVLFSLESIASFRGIFAVVYFGVGEFFRCSFLFFTLPSFLFSPSDSFALLFSSLLGYCVFQMYPMLIITAARVRLLLLAFLQRHI